MSETFATLKARADATAVAWVEISGIPYAFSDGFITESNKATLFTDAYTPTLTFYGALAEPNYHESRSIELLSGKGNRGGFSIKLTDFVASGKLDGFFTWLFGSERSGIARTRLAVGVGKHVGGAGHDWEVDSAVTLGSMPRDVYCGLETVQPQTEADPLLEDVVRSRWRSPCISHKANSADVFPEVTDHPTVWRGRIVRLFVTFAAGGELAGGAATARSSAHQIVGVLESVSWDGEAWVLQCDSIDKLLDREACKGLASARVSRVIPTVQGGFLGFDADASAGYLTQAPVLIVSSWNETDGVEHVYDVYITEGPYSIDRFIAAINAYFVAGFNARDGTAWRGELSLAYDGTDLRIDYVTSAVAAEVQSCSVNFSEFFRNADGGGNTAELYWSRILVNPWAWVDVSELQAVASTVYSVHVPALSETILPAGRGVAVTVPLAAGEDDSGPNDFSAAVGDHWRVVVESQTGRQFAGVSSVNASNGTITVIFKAPFIGDHVGTAEHPIRVTLVCWLTTMQAFGRLGPVGSGVLRLLLSTGQSGYNQADYDTLAEGLGIEWPHETPTASADTTASLLDLESFERAFADAASYCEYIEDVFWKPFRFRDWLEKRLGFFGYYLTIENGQLRARAGLMRLQHQQDAAITKGETLEGAVSFGQNAGIRGIRYVTGDEQRGHAVYTRTYLIGHKADQDLQILEHRDAGVITDPERLFRLSQNVLVEYAKEAWQYTLNVDRALLDVEPGMVVAVSDTGASDSTSFAGRGFPNPDGTRGLTEVRMLVLSAETDWSEGIQTRLALLHTKTKRGGYSASAWIVSHAGAPSVLTCSANVFSPTEDGVDASRFAVGDRIRVLAVNPLTTENGEQAFYITAIVGNAITLSGAIDTAGANAHFASGEPLVITHNKYETASQTATAQSWAHIGDASGDIDDGGDSCFEW